MKKFKHTKTGKIVSCTDISLYQDEDGNYIPNWIIENGKDWEEIKEVEYEILTLINKNGHTLASYDKAEVGTYNKPMCQIYKSREYFVKCFLNATVLSAKSPEWKIYAVKRLSDNEIFTLGDIIQTNIGLFILKSMSLIDNKIVSKVHTFTIFLDSLKKDKTEKEWEITAYKDINKNRIFKRNESNEFVYNASKCRICMTEGLFKDGKNYEIYSVKRLIDGVNFKIGDKYNFGGSMGKNLAITAFKVVDNNLRFNDEQNNEWNIKGIDKVEKLFTTEDGKDIYKGDKYYWLSQVTYNSFAQPFEIIEVQSAKDQDDKEFDKKYKVLNFSNKELAQNYIDLHKPKYSLNDVINKLHHEYRSAPLEVILRIFK